MSILIYERHPRKKCDIVWCNPEESTLSSGGAAFLGLSQELHLRAYYFYKMRCLLYYTRDL